MQHSGQNFLQKSFFGSWHGNSQVRPAGTGRLYGVAGQASAVIGYGMWGLAGAIGSRGRSELDSRGQSPFARRGWPRQSSFYVLLLHYRPASPCGEITRVTRCYPLNPAARFYKTSSGYMAAECCQTGVRLNCEDPKALAIQPWLHSTAL